jgi:hypothetical protein
MENSNKLLNGVNYLYDGADDLGKLMSIIKLIGGIILGLVAILSGSYLIFNNNDNNFYYVPAKIADVKCNFLNKDSKNNKMYDCKFKVEFDLDNKKNTGEFNTITSNNNYYTGQNMDITVNKFNINEITTSTIKTRTVGIIIICISLLIFGGSSLNYYLSKKNKLYSAVQGVQTVSNLFRSIG